MSDTKSNSPTSSIQPSVASSSTTPFTGLEAHGDAVLSDGPTLRFVREKGIFRPLNHPPNLQNSLLSTVGYLELANAGDFAANYWNDSPLPLYAVGLMAFGGTLAFVMLDFARRDARLSWQNIRGLLAERRSLLTQRSQHERQESQEAIIRAIDCYLYVNFREFGTEIMDRLFMDSFLGFGAILVGVGTYMAIAGANPHIFFASNLLTGHIGNSPCALFGLMNFLWSSWVWLRARDHRKVTSADLVGDPKLQAMIRRRTLYVQLHSILSGVAALIAGGAALATATEPWAYVALAPCISASVIANYLWRQSVGYSRPFVTQLVSELNELLLTSALSNVSLCTQRLQHGDVSETALSLVQDLDSFHSILDLIIRNGLYETFCLVLLHSEVLAEPVPCSEMQELQSTQLAASLGTMTLTVDAENLKMLARNDVNLAGKLLKIAKLVVEEVLPSSLHHQERWLLEMLGCYMALVKVSGGDSESSLTASVNSSDSWEKGNIRSTTASTTRRARRYRNSNSYCGRHTDQRLKLEFSLVDVLMRKLNKLAMAPWVGRLLARP